MGDEINLPQSWADFWAMRLRESDSLTSHLTSRKHWIRPEELFLAMSLLMQAVNNYHEYHGKKLKREDWEPMAPSLYWMRQWNVHPKEDNIVRPTAFSCATLLEEIAALEKRFKNTPGLGDILENSRQVVESFAGQD